jgi:uncharacterized radical SAM superfamily Fe-S cluster-containing enzyme
LAVHSSQTHLTPTLRFASDPALACPSVAMGFLHANGSPVASAGSVNDGVTFTRDAHGVGQATLSFPRLPLLKGDYTINVFLLCERGLHVYDHAERVATLRVVQQGLEQGLVTLPHAWDTGRRRLLSHTPAPCRATGAGPGPEAKALPWGVSRPIAPAMGLWSGLRPTGWPATTCRGHRPTSAPCLRPLLPLSARLGRRQASAVDPGAVASPARPMRRRWRQRSAAPRAPVRHRAARAQPRPRLASSAGRDLGRPGVDGVHDFHHTLFALAGRAGGRICVIAAPEESSPLHPWLGPTIHALHRDCAGHFNGGDYLFLAPGESGTGVAHALRRGEWVFSLHDFEAPEGTRRHNAQVLNRQFQAPSGALELALRMGKPVYFAALVWQPGRRSYHLHARLLGPDAADPLVAYTQALAQLVRQWPWAWSGWQWFDSWSPLGDPLQRNECERLLDLTDLWQQAHPHPRPPATRAAAPRRPAPLPLCPRRRIRRAGAPDFLTPGGLRRAPQVQVHYCPTCHRFSLDGAGWAAACQSLGLPPGSPPVAVDARLWSRAPTFLNIEPTTRCNFACWYCVGRHMAQRDIAVEDFARVLDHFPTVQAIALVGEGEPLMHKGFFDMARMAADRGIRVLTISNGSTFSSANVAKLCESGISYVSVSIDSVDPATFARRAWKATSSRCSPASQAGRLPRPARLRTRASDSRERCLPTRRTSCCPLWTWPRRMAGYLRGFLRSTPCRPTYHILAQLAQLQAVPRVAEAIGRDSPQALHRLQPAASFCQEEGIRIDKNGNPNGVRPGCDEEWVYTLLSGDITPCCQIKNPPSPHWNLAKRPLEEILRDPDYEATRFNLWNGLFPRYRQDCWKTR